MLYVICGFVFGCLIPFFARRVGKSMPATMGYILLKMFIPYHYMPWSKLRTNQKYMELFKRYIMRSIGWGIFTAAVTYLFATLFTKFTFAGSVRDIYFHIAFLWILLLLVEIDKRFMLLPDVFTVPLLILGFFYAAFQGQWIVTSAPEFLNYAQHSAMGAVFGYAMPVIASMFIVWKYPDAFGGGDIKLLAALGAWVGPEIITYILLGSCVIFAVTCLINHSRVGPFGPAIIYAALLIITFFFAG
ncbi:MAG: prepilin peptidase [Alphaproteobacteria bacterium]|nr:prepilin peptidase [Alphaproteobacteria bacterium]